MTTKRVDLLRQRFAARVDEIDAEIRRDLRFPLFGDIRDRIAALRDDAGNASDLEQVELCNRALVGDPEAIRECARVLAEAEVWDA